MLIATLTTILLISLGLGGSQLDNLFLEIKKPVKQTIEDKERRSEILQVRDQLEKDLKQSGKDWKRELAEFLEVQGTYDSTAADFDEQHEQIGELLADRHKAVLDARDEMKALMSREEWEQVFAAEED